MTKHKTDAQMKWYGWGDPEKHFPMAEKPLLWPYIFNACGLDSNEVTTPSKTLEEINLPKPKQHSNFIAALTTKLLPNQIKQDDYERLIHSYGKSFRDLWRIRNGMIDSAPDLICYPESEQDVENIIRIAHQHNVVVIPFGGGSNIAGCLESKDVTERMVVCVDMKRMNQVIEIDCQSMTARIQAGALGPELEKTLNEKGMTLGHFPDSFEYSSIGGWIATRSAGMKSDKYGKIEDMLISLRVVTPVGMIESRTVPKSSNGININHICIGSEGIIGIITEVTVQIHPLPKYKMIYGYLFPTFESGIAALYECVIQDCLPAMTRLSDAEKTKLSFAFKTPGNWFSKKMAATVKSYLKTIKSFDMNEVCLLLVGFEGDKKQFNLQRKKVHRIYRKHGAFNLGNAPGKSFEKGKYDFPYLRDVVMDYGISVDVSETATVWSQLSSLYQNVTQEIKEAIASSGSKPWCACHISHTYRTGASLYFTFGFKQTPDDVLGQYNKVKHAAENAFLKYGGTLSHHHAVGYEHMPWIEADISLAGTKAIEGIKNSLDPRGIMNPGKIIAMDSLSSNALEERASERW